MKPCVGDVVHYQAYGTPAGEFKSVPRAAIIAGVADAEKGTCDLVVLNPQGLFFNRCEYSEAPKPGCWSWPRRES